MTKLNKEFLANTYQANIDKLIGICYRYTGNHQLSEDLAHDAFLKAIEKSSTFRGEGSFDAWLRQIVVNHVLQYLRDQKKIALQHLDPEEEVNISFREETTETVLPDFTENELLETITRLPEHHKLVFNLYVIDKFTHARIGEVLGISEGTSKSHLARARKKLQQLLAEKIDNQKTGKNKEKTTILLLAVTNEASMDEMFIKRLDQFSIAPKNPLTFYSGHYAYDYVLKKILSSKLFQIAGSVVVMVTIAVMILFGAGKSDKTENSIANASRSAAILTLPDSPDRENMTRNISSSAATILHDSINKGRNVKTNSMKALDSLALMVALSTGIVNVSSSKDSIMNKIQTPDGVIASISADSSQSPDQLKNVQIPVTMQEERGTFRASSLYWDNGNMEVIFKGEVRVDFKDQHFKGNGSFNILGKVYLLMVNDQPAVLGRTIQLASEDYTLAVLNSTDAIAKYGDAGKNGAVVIRRSK